MLQLIDGVCDATGATKKEIVDFLDRNDLPQCVSLRVGEALYVFSSWQERLQFVAGMRFANQDRSETVDGFKVDRSPDYITLTDGNVRIVFGRYSGHSNATHSGSGKSARYVIDVADDDTMIREAIRKFKEIYDTWPYQVVYP